MSRVNCFLLGLVISFSGFGQSWSPDDIRTMDSLTNVIKDQTLPDTSKVRARLSLANYYYRINLDTTFLLCHEAEELSEKYGWDFGMTESFGWLGYLYTVTGELDKAIEYNDKSMLLAKKTGDIVSITTLLNNNASIFHAQGKIDKSLECYYKALQIHESSGNKKEIARTLNSLAVLNKEQGFEDRALDLYGKSLAIRRELGDSAEIGETLNNLGVIYANQGKYEEAEKYYRESLALRMKHGSPAEQANSLNNLGILMSMIGYHDSALTYLYQSLEIREKYGLGPGISEVLIDIGFAYSQKADYPNAEKYSLRGYKMAKEFGIVRLIKNSTGTLYSIYEEQNQNGKAYEYFKEFVAMRDSLSNTESQRNTVLRDAQYSYDKQKAIDDAENEKRTALHKAEKKRQRIIIFTAIGGLVLLVVFLLFVFNRLQVTRKQKSIIEAQKLIVEQKKIEIENAHEILEEKNSEILDSIIYAKRIQSAILPPDKQFSNALPNSFVLYLPKDIVAGDFYWLADQSLNEQDRLILFAAADCTGHGVPGALVSVVCNNALNRSVREYGLTDPGKILDKTREIVILEFEKSDEEVKDGMDIALVSLSLNKKNEKQNENENLHSASHSVLRYAGANNPLWLIRNGELLEYKPDKQPIGKYDQTISYTTHSIELEPGDTLYIFSDGYPDQFGGDRGKKMKSKGFKDLLLTIQDKPMDEQKSFLHHEFHKWRGDFEQLDDICVIGVRI